MYIFLVLPAILAELVFGILLVSAPNPRAKPLPTNNFGLPKVLPIELGTFWPFISPFFFSLVYLFNQAYITTNTGSRIKSDLKAFQANSYAQSYRCYLEGSNDVIKLAPAGLGTLYMQGASRVRVSYSIQAANSNTITDITTFLNENAPICIPLSRLVGLITFDRPHDYNDDPIISLLSFRIWSEEFAKPSVGNYLLEHFIETNNAGTLVMSDINNQLRITQSNPSLSTLVQLPATQTPVTPKEFIDKLNAAIIAAGFNDLEASFDPYDTQKSGLYHIARLRWKCTSSPQSYLIEPDASATFQQQCATAATYGLYTFDPAIVADATITSINVGDGGTYPTEVVSPSPTYVQWPITWTTEVYTSPGSPDTDGYAQFTTTLGVSPPTTSYYTASNNRHTILYGPTTTLRRLPFVFHVPNYDMQMAYCNVDLVASTSTDQLYSISSIEFENTEGIYQFFQENLLGTFALRSTGTSQTGYLATPPDVLSNLFTNTTSQNAICALNASFSVGPVNIPVSQSIYDDVSITIDICDATLSTIFGTLEGTISFRSADTTIVRYNLSELPDIPDILKTQFGDTVVVTAWSAGGASILNQAVRKYGGAGPRASLDLVVLSPITSVDIRIGQKGIRDTEYRGTGGTDTRINFNGTTILHLGGGAGASTHSHGGIGGAPLNGLSTNVAVPGGPNLVYNGYSGSFAPFTSNNTNLTQVAGPILKPTNESVQGSGAGSELAGDPVVAGNNGFSDLNGVPLLGRRGGLGGIGFGGEIGLFDQYKPVTGGFGSIQTTTYKTVKTVGAGGGGASMVLNVGTHDSLVNVTNLQITPGFVNLSGFLVGGGLPPKTSGPPLPWFTEDPKFCNTESLLTLGLSYVWTRDKHENFVTDLLNGLVREICEPAGEPPVLLQPDRTTHYIWPYQTILEDAPITDTQIIQSAVPVSIHDAPQFPSTNQNNIRSVSTGGETGLLDSNTTLCIYNDGQITTNDLPYVTNSILTGSYVPPGTYVTNISFGNSQPRGIYQCIYLKLSNAILSDEGSLTWYYGENTIWDPLDPPTVMRTGVEFRGLLKREGTTASNPWDVTSLLQNISQTVSNDFSTLVLNTMAHSYFQSSDVFSLVNPSTYFPNVFTLPADDATIGPTYLSSVWPMSTSLENPQNDIVTIRSFVRPNEFTQTENFGLRRQIEIFNYSGSVITYTIPEYAKQVVFYCYGAGATSVVGSSFSGSVGTFVQGSFKNLSNHSLQIYVGQPGDASSVPVIGLSGGLLEGAPFGGGYSGIFDVTSNKYLIVAGGGGSGGMNSDGIPESVKGTPSQSGPLNGIVGAYNAFEGENASGTSGPGGSGVFGGTAGKLGYGGGAGLSLIPTGGFKNTKLSVCPFYETSVGFGASNGLPAGNGLVVIEFTY